MSQPDAPVNPLSPDAPLVELLSVKDNPLLVDMTEEELTAYVKKLRQMATTPQTLSAKISSESGAIKSKRTSSKRAAILDSI